MRPLSIRYFRPRFSATCRHHLPTTYPAEFLQVPRVLSSSSHCKKLEVQEVPAKSAVSRQIISATSSPSKSHYSDEQTGFITKVWKIVSLPSSFSRSTLTTHSISLNRLMIMTMKLPPPATATTHYAVRSTLISEARYK